MTKKTICFKLKNQEFNPNIKEGELTGIATRYYQKNDIKIMKLSDEDKELLDIVFNDSRRKRSDDFSNFLDKQRIEQVKIWLKSNDKSFLDLSELVEKEKQNNFDFTPWLVGGILVSVIILFLVVRKKRKRNYVK